MISSNSPPDDDSTQKKPPSMNDDIDLTSLILLSAAADASGSNQHAEITGTTTMGVVFSNLPTPNPGEASTMLRGYIREERKIYQENKRAILRHLPTTKRRKTRYLNHQQLSTKH